MKRPNQMIRTDGSILDARTKSIDDEKGLSCTSNDFRAQVPQFLE